jgi:hypothetical protein
MMVGTATKKAPSVLALTNAWVLSLASEVAWLIGLYDYDGEMGDTSRPPIGATIVWAAVVATALVAVAWLGWRFRRTAMTGFWLFLIGAFAAKGLLAAGLEELSVLFYGAAPFTLGGSYRSETLSIATALASGVVVALIVRAVDARRTSVTDPVATHFD